MIEVRENRLRCHFTDYGPEAYGQFLKLKQLPETDVEFHPETETYTLSAPSRYAEMLGLEVPTERNPLPPAEFLYDDQRSIVEMAVRARRFACWSDCGLGKTYIEAEFARQVHHRTGGKVLVVTQNEIVSQWLEMVGERYPEMEVLRLKNQDQMRSWAESPDGPFLAITNYEKFNPRGEDQNIRELRHLAGVVLDESSRLKTGGGKQKWAIIKSCKGIEYKLSATATPAPNDCMEYASQASFLERMRSEQEIIWTFFSKNKSGEWTVKRHARRDFFRWMASWSIYVRDPRAYGWRPGWEPPPPPEYFFHAIEVQQEQLDAARKYITEPSGQTRMFDGASQGIVGRTVMSEIAKGFVYHDKKNRKKFKRIPSLKPQVVADLAYQENAAGHQVLIWVEYDAEATLISELLEPAEVEYQILSGSVPRPKREPILSGFRHGEIPVLIGKTSMIGYGQNFQNCTSMIFSGWSDSFENFFQAVRRAYRDGQRNALRVHLPVIQDLEGDMLENILEKQERHESAIREMEKTYLQAQQELKGVLP